MENLDALGSSDRVAGEPADDNLRSLIRERIARLACAAGTTPLDVACLIVGNGQDLVIDLHVPATLQRSQRAAFAVRALDAVHASGRTYGQVDVRVHGHAA